MGRSGNFRRIHRAIGSNQYRGRILFCHKHLETAVCADTKPVPGPGLSITVIQMEFSRLPAATPARIPPTSVFFGGILPMFIILSPTPKAMSSAFLDISRVGWQTTPATYPTDISQFNYPTDGNAQPTTLAQQLQNAQDAGFNMIRINTQEDAFDHLSPYGRFNINNTGKNEYDLNQGFICDELMAAIHRVNFKCLMSFWNAPGNWVPGTTVTNAGAPTTQAALRYHQYMINRFGAYVDIWELCNESTIFSKLRRYSVKSLPH